MMNDSGYLKKRRHSVSDLYLFAIFGIFVVFSLLIVVLGVKVFQGVASATDINNEVRSSLFYVANKIRSADQTDGIRIEIKNGILVLILEGDYTEGDYETVIYYHNGSIRELLNKKDSEFDPDLGDSIIKTNGFIIEKNGNLMFLSITASDAQTYSMHIRLQSRQ